MHSSDLDPGNAALASQIIRDIALRYILRLIGQGTPGMSHVVVEERVSRGQLEDGVGAGGGTCHTNSRIGLQISSTEMMLYLACTHSAQGVETGNTQSKLGIILHKLANSEFSETLTQRIKLITRKEDT